MGLGGGGLGGGRVGVSRVVVEMCEGWGGDILRDRTRCCGGGVWGGVFGGVKVEGWNRGRFGRDWVCGVSVVVVVRCSGSVRGVWSADLGWESLASWVGVG